MKLVTWTAIVFCLSTTSAMAFDDKRSGFILGLGAGMHSVNVDFQSNGNSLGSTSENGFASSFRAGFGFGERFSLCYMREASWYSAPYSDGFSTSDTTYVVGLTGIGASYYLGDGPSFYFVAGIGIGDIETPFQNANPDTGRAWLLGAGYEISQHLSIEGKYLAANITSADISSLTLKTSSPMFTINYTWY